MFNSEWFNTLAKPMFTPPAWIFTPAWIILYGMIFVSLLIYTLHVSRCSKIPGYIFFVIQMALNIIWSPIFFGLRNIQAALCIIILLDIFAVLTLTYFLRISKSAALIFTPYVLWLFYATYLNGGYVVLNN